MKKLTLIIFIISIFTANASGNSYEAKKTPTYTHEQGLAISLDISTCLVSDNGVKKLIDEILDRFEKETGTRDLIILALVMEISRKYRIDLEKKFVPSEFRGYVKSVVKECKKVAEIDYLK